MPLERNRFASKSTIAMQLHLSKSTIRHRAIEMRLSSTVQKFNVILLSFLNFMPLSRQNIALFNKTMRHPILQYQRRNFRFVLAFIEKLFEQS
jgi:hypothetical protein